jgi:hypothetical protein
MVPPSTRVKEEVIVIGFNHPQTLSLSPKTVTHPTTKLGHLNTSPTMLMGFQIQIQGLLVKSVTKLVTRQGFAIGGMTKIKNGNLNQNSRHTILNPLPLIKIWLNGWSIRVLQTMSQVTSIICQPSIPTMDPINFKLVMDLDLLFLILVPPLLKSYILLLNSITYFMYQISALILLVYQNFFKIIFFLKLIFLFLFVI